MKLPAIFCLAAAALFVGGCVSSIQPLQPVRRVEVWVPDTMPAAGLRTVPGTQPATLAATSPATAPATQPGHNVVRVIDPNETFRYVYDANYDTIWKQAVLLLHRTGFSLDRQDYRLGTLTTQPLPSVQILEVWKPQQVNAKDALENTINDQRRAVRLTIEKVPGKPDFYQIGIQVTVERLTNPSEMLSGPLFVEGSGFGRNALALRSDYASLQPQSPEWVTLGHDPDMEKKLLDALLQRI